MDPKKKRELKRKAIGLSALFIAAVVSVFVWLNSSFGWFASNKQVDSDLAGVSANALDADLRIHYDGMTVVESLMTGAPISFELDIPGASTDFVIEARNLSNSPITVTSVRFLAPSATEEVPVIENAVNYWFSTQLYVKIADVTPVSGTPTASAVTTALNAISGNGTVLGTTSTRGDFELLGGNVVLDAGESVYLAVRVTFVNLNEDQSIYRNFGVDTHGQNPAPCLKRRVAVSFE